MTQIIIADANTIRQGAAGMDHCYSGTTGVAAISAEMPFFDRQLHSLCHQLSIFSIPIRRYLEREAAIEQIERLKAFAAASLFIPGAGLTAGSSSALIF
jgi:hypothetical protein